MLKKRTKLYNKNSPCDVCAIYQLFYNHSIACYEEQTEILVVQHDLFRQSLSGFIILMYYFMCVHIGLYVIMVCHVPYIDMPCMPGLMNLTAVASVKSVSLINGLSWRY